MYKIFVLQYSRRNIDVNNQTPRTRREANTEEENYPRPTQQDVNMTEENHTQTTQEEVNMEEENHPQPTQQEVNMEEENHPQPTKSNAKTAKTRQQQNRPRSSNLCWPQQTNAQPTSHLKRSLRNRQAVKSKITKHQTPNLVRPQQTAKKSALKENTKNKRKGEIQSIETTRQLRARIKCTQ